jgi:hypothetical protein
MADVALSSPCCPRGQMARRLIWTVCINPLHHMHKFWIVSVEGWVIRIRQKELETKCPSMNDLKI